MSSRYYGHRPRYDADRIFTLRAQGLTYEEISKEVGCSLATVGHYIAGRGYAGRIKYLTDDNLRSAQETLTAQLREITIRLSLIKKERKERRAQRKVVSSVDEEVRPGTDLARLGGTEAG